MKPEKIERINELKRISRDRQLTVEETKEQAALRQEYIVGFRANMQQLLDNISVKDPSGTVRPLRKNERYLSKE